MAEELERIYVVPLGAAYEKPRVKRANRTVKLLRSFIARHMKAGEESVSLSSAVNSAIWESGIKKPPRRLKVIANRNKEGKVNVYLSGEKEEQAKASEITEKRKEAKKKLAGEKKEATPKKEEKKQEPVAAPEKPEAKSDVPTAQKKNSAPKKKEKS
ncbi:MAG: 50S ribosomal protein L31e [Candidatus Micrarchaeota archaeon]